MVKKKKKQVNKISYQFLEKKKKKKSLLSNAGGVSVVGTETTPTRRKAASSLNCQLQINLNKETKLFCKCSQPGNNALRDEGIASK